LGVLVWQRACRLLRGSNPPLQLNALGHQLDVAALQLRGSFLPPQQVLTL
jgi:hypothetical protein